MIIALYEDSECCVRTENGDTRFFKIMSGVKQGSPFLFVIVMDYILRQSSGIGVKISSRQISDLDFADDVFLLEEAKLRLQLLLDAIDEKAEKMGLAVLERIIFRSLSPFVFGNHSSDSLIYPHQYRFRAKFLTPHALIDTTQFIRSQLDRKNTVLGLFLDSSKAFDMVDHSVLLSKLNSLGNRGVPFSWFGSYLSGRVQSLLLSNGADLNLKDGNKRTALHFAAERGTLDICQLLLSNRADPKVKDLYDETALHYAAKRGTLDICQLLLNNRGDPNIQDFFKRTALYFAGERGTLDICQLLNNRGDPNIQDFF
ncbi:putative ankyrin repeat protein RF_0381 [Artemia franciscana]|uniref:putative ankyrin repeat protein RF_0381 n=1 Tax=Artemia franciscana TaxID=6661 RepID=UPI0032DB9F86